MEIKKVDLIFSSLGKFFIGNIFQIVELFLLLLVTYWVAGKLLDWNPLLVNGGREWGVSVHTHHVWNWVKTCGTCALWNGHILGGYPSLLEIHSASFHPLVAFFTLLFDVNNGARITLFFALFLAGVGQWWLCQIFGLSRIARLWAGTIAICGGYILGRFELGAFMVPFSVAMISLMLPGIINVYVNPNVRSSIILAAIFSSALLSGSAYMQIGLLAILPAFIFLFFDFSSFRIRDNFKYYLLSFTLGLLLAAFWIFPVIINFSSLGKIRSLGALDQYPIGVMLLNLVIKDPKFFMNAQINMPGLPHLIIQFAGWTTVVSAIIGIFLSNKIGLQTKLFLLSSISMIYLTAAGNLINLLATYFPIVLWARNHVQIASVAIPLIIFLSALGVDFLINYKLGIELSININNRSLFFPINFLLIIPMVFTLVNARNLVTQWVFFDDIHPDIFMAINQTKKFVQDDQSLAWIQTKVGAHYWDEISISSGLKISEFLQSMILSERENPPIRYAIAIDVINDQEASLLAEFGSNLVYKYDNDYASVSQPNGIVIPCNSSGEGGWINVGCDLPEPGTLKVYEHMWSGWNAKINGQSTVLIGDEWLEINLPKGNNKVEFRYNPWESYLGILFTTIGLVLTIYLWKSNNGSPRIEEIHIGV